ncbi:MAG TPA: LysR family transcriptional regulator [Burkholderiaceae bacterium]|nr:LysR family transcriptional regulator [Burkholderiaceae bacterium]
MLKLDGIACFVAVVESGSISEAARQLQLSKSVISERLADLEQSLGVKLIHRTTRKHTLTKDGEMFLQRAARIMRELEEAKSEMAESRGSLEGTLRISAPVTFGRMHLGPAVYPFLAQNPLLALTLDLDDRRVEVASSGYDGVVRHGVLEDSRLTAWQLAPSKRILVASPKYLERWGTPTNVNDLSRHRGIYYTNRGAADWRFLDNEGATVVRAPAALRVNNGDVMRDAAVAGLGIALLPTFIVGESVRAGALCMIDIGMSAATESIYIAHAEGRRPSARMRAFADSMRAAFGNPPYWDS